MVKEQQDENRRTAPAGHVLVLFVGLLLTSCAAPAARDTVARYCSLDLSGARLSGTTYAPMEELVTWQTEPGWDETVVVSNFRIRSTRSVGFRAWVTVEFTRLGSLAGSNWLPAAPQTTDRVQFTLRHTAGNWRIVEPIDTPRVSPSALLAHLNTLIAVEGAAHRPDLVRATAQLKRLVGNPEP